MNSRRFLSLAVVMFVVASAPAFAAHSWGTYHWARTSNPFTLKVGNNMTASWQTYYNAAVSDWNGMTVMNLNSVAGTSAGKCRPVAGTVQVCNGSYGSNGWLGLASISLTGGHISQGTAKMNDTYFNTATYNNPNEKLHVVCQEVGHDFGLGHTSEDGSSQNTCMDYFSNTGANATSTLSTTTNAHDNEQMSIIYNHLDSTTTIASFDEVMNARSEALSVPLNAGVDRDEPWQWGTAIDFDEAGRANSFRLELASGETVITHVIWADEADNDHVAGADQR